MSLDLTYHASTAVLTMDDGKVNALDNTWFRTMLAHLDAVEASDATGLILIGRTGVFSGGLNIKWLPTMNKLDTTEFGQLFGGTLNRLYQFPKPTIAAVSGHAIAGGCLLACACDVRYAVHGRFNMAMNETLIKMTIPAWANKIIENVVPKPYATAMLSMAEFMSFEQAESLGIISQRFDDHASLMAAALEKAETFKQFSMPNFTANKLSVRTL
ncbi:MAG: enoyl-CoA hydratase [Candidatus Azotimanducaceae bacterium]|jgi:enoyl-CoA hydratase